MNLSAQTNSILNRLQAKLQDTDIMVIQQAVLRYVIQENINIENVKGDLATVKDILKHIQYLSNDWQQIQKQNLKSTLPAVKHLLEVVRSQFKSPDFLRRKVEEARELSSYQPIQGSDTQSEQSFGKIQRQTRMATRGDLSQSILQKEDINIKPASQSAPSSPEKNKSSSPKKSGRGGPTKQPVDTAKPQLQLKEPISGKTGNGKTGKIGETRKISQRQSYEQISRLYQAQDHGNIVVAKPSTSLRDKWGNEVGSCQHVFRYQLEVQKAWTVLAIKKREAKAAQKEYLKLTSGNHFYNEPTSDEDVCGPQTDALVHAVSCMQHPSNQCSGICNRQQSDGRSNKSMGSFNETGQISVDKHNNDVNPSQHVSQHQ